MNERSVSMESGDMTDLELIQRDQAGLKRIFDLHWEKNTEWALRAQELLDKMGKVSTALGNNKSYPDQIEPADDLSFKANQLILEVEKGKKV